MAETRRSFRLTTSQYLKFSNRERSSLSINNSGHAQWTFGLRPCGFRNQKRRREDRARDRAVSISRSTLVWRFLVVGLACPSMWLMVDRSTPDFRSATAVLCRILCGCRRFLWRLGTSSQARWRHRARYGESQSELKVCSGDSKTRDGPTEDPDLIVYKRSATPLQSAARADNTVLFSLCETISR
jgi:hypothetical protein